MVVNGIITILAPLAGGLAFIRSNMAFYFHNFNYCGTHHFNWRRFSIKTSKDDLKQVNLVASLKTLEVYEKTNIIIPMLLQGLTYVMLFSYSSASPFITQKLYNMTPPTI